MTVQATNSSTVDLLGSGDVHVKGTFQQRDTGRGEVSHAPENRGSAAQSGERRGSFERLLRSTASPASNTLQETSSETEEVLSREMTEEEISRIVIPLIDRGMEQARAVAELLAAQLVQGDWKGAAAVAAGALEKASRFDPNLILGKGFTEGPLHQAIRDFLAKTGGLLDGSTGQKEAFSPGDVSELNGLDDSQTIDGGEDLLVQTAKDETRTGGETSNVGRKEEWVAGEPDLLKHVEDAERSLLHRGKEAEQIKDGPGNEFASTTRAKAFAEQMGLVTESGDAKTHLENPKEEADSVGLHESVPENRPSRDAGKGTGEGGSFPSGNRADDKKSPSMPLARNNRVQASGGSMQEQDVSQAKGFHFAGELAATLRSRVDGSQEVLSSRSIHEIPSTYVLDSRDAFGDGLSTVLQFMRNEGAQEARIVVEPPALGRMDISLQSTGSGIEAVFKVDNEHLKQVLQQQLDTLKTSLQAQGIHVSGLAVDIKNRDDRHRGDLYPGGKRQRRVGGTEATEDRTMETPLIRLDLEKGLLHWVA